jgi:hypothetical protein
MATEPLFPHGNPDAVAPADAVAVVHRFLDRCAAWGLDREIPARLERMAADPSPENAAKLHQWASWVAFVRHAQRELESGQLDSWFGPSAPDGWADPPRPDKGAAPGPDPARRAR